ncbi:MAG TPA: tRNA (N6-isopentenyl adenosine(37)-C2)-methylthiotransferase MiaB, partial [Acidimicrobiales bacterium]|nr:tRNA (N6-isopentenyl adenosine(37)-C2)-methylthiotransferase MiaB [Acidimicrobiales bacterium]
KALKDQNPALQIAVGGCLAQKDRETIVSRAPHVDVVFGTHNVGRIGDLLGLAASSVSSIVEVLDAPDTSEPQAFHLPVMRESTFASWVTIQVGCDNSCAFCIVPSVRGGEVSRPIDDIISEINILASSGITEVTLLGQNVNSYGRDITRRRPLFADLLHAVGQVDGIRRVRFTSPHPKDLRPETIEAMATVPSVCEHLHLPLQSGSDRILAAMHRGYTASRYLDRLNAARSMIPDLAVTTDIIVGFPGESDEDFEKTLEVAAEAQYDSAYTFIFSPRPGTEAAQLQDKFVQSEVVSERFERLKVVIDRSGLAKHRDRVGRTEEILIEGPSKRNPDVFTGRTRQNKLVHFEPTPECKPGMYASAVINYGSPHFLRGEVDNLEIATRIRRRLPVLSG